MAITASMVAELRAKTDAPMMECKKALTEANGDMAKAEELLRVKLGSKAGKAASRITAEGVVAIHMEGGVGALVEVNCETDFVARGELFQELLRNVAMQIAACPNVEYVTTDEIPAEVAEREKAIEMGRDDLSGKKPEMKIKIVEGRIGKRLKEMALLEQPFIRDPNMTLGELVKQAAGKTGENIQVRRFTRYTLGEGIEVEKVDFATEVASMGKTA
jgi:elongation factor Ts